MNLTKESEEQEETGLEALLAAAEEKDEVTEHPVCSIDNPECETCSG